MNESYSLSDNLISSSLGKGGVINYPKIGTKKLQPAMDDIMERNTGETLLYGYYNDED